MTADGKRRCCTRREIDLLHERIELRRIAERAARRGAPTDEERVEMARIKGKIAQKKTELASHDCENDDTLIGDES